MKVINRTSHLIIAGCVLLVPSTPTECDFAEMKKTYPKLAEEERAGRIQIVSEETAKIEAEEVEQKTVKELKEYADRKGINLDGCKNKADILNAIKVSEG